VTCRLAGALAALVLVALLTGCGAVETADVGSEPRTVSGHGLRIELPSGWDGVVVKSGLNVAPLLRAANFPLTEPPSDIGRLSQRTMGADDVLITIVDYGEVPGAMESKQAQPVRLGRSDVTSFEGFLEPVATHSLTVKGHTLQLWIVAAKEPTDLQLEQANAVLATLEVAGPQDTESATGVHRDEDRGLSVRYPPDWSVAQNPLTNVIVPRELVALSTYPLRGGGKGGGPCAAKSDLEAIPPDGALIWLLEYRPLRGDVWADLRRSSFPPRPQRFELARDDLQPNSCLTGVGYAPRASGPLVYTTTFRAADRPLQLSLVFGERVTDTRLAEVEEILKSLELTELPPPPPDPYGGWPLMNDNPGDSLRPPPGWPAAAAMFPPGETPRPRPLFFTSNRPLFGLPQTLVPQVDRLPGPWPSHAVANDFPADGVLLWVLEEATGGASAEFPSIERGWPGEDEFRPGQILTKPNPALRWLRAGGSFKGYRFSVWIATGPAATTEDSKLALKSAATLAVSGCWRDRFDDCPDG
jgi:hypothetical protein